MKYLISFSILAIAIFISLSETRKLSREIVENDRQDRRKWEPYYRCHRTSEIVKMAIKQYNHDHHTHYRKKRISLAEKTVERPSKIRVLFKACTKTCKRHSKDRIISRRYRRHRKACDNFRATFEKEGRAGKPTIRVRKLDGKEDTKEHRPTGRGTIRSPKQSSTKRRDERKSSKSPEPEKRQRRRRE